MKGQWNAGNGDGAWNDRGQAAETHTRLALRVTTVAGAVAGDVAVTGIEVGDHLVAVINLADGLDLTAEFTVTDTDTINNADGSATDGDRLLVVYLK